MPQRRVVLKNSGVIDPEDISTYLDQKGFEALVRVRKEMTPEAVIDEVNASGLRGRGGAGFPCGSKWELAARQKGPERFLICNADEGEMGTFKDRYLLQTDPFTLIEGMAIACHAIGANRAYIYLRAEYRHLLERLKNAIRQATENGFLETLDVEIREGAGAYVCGEESALMNSIEGKRGEARYRPPYPPTEGLWQQPTIINNVETLMNIPQIILNGASWFRKMGTAESSGTKVFSVSGDVASPGVYELEMGILLSELVADLAGAIDMKMIQVGGATGRILPAVMIETPLSFETVIGSGGVVVFDQSRDPIDVLHRTIAFLAEESCGRCTPCREGTEAMVEILERLTRGEGVKDDVNVLKDLSNTMRVSALCGLGQGAFFSVMDSLTYFEDEFENRIDQSLFLRSLKG